MSRLYNYALLLLMMGSSMAVYSQNPRVQELETLYQTADRQCYDSLIWKSMYEYNRWCNDSIRTYTIFKPNHVDIDLGKGKKLYMLAVEFSSEIENFKEGDDIYDYVIIDSCRTFVNVFLNEKGLIDGITDCRFVGKFCNLKEEMVPLFGITRKDYRKKIKQMLKLMPNPDAMLCVSSYVNFWFVKDHRIFVLFRDKMVDLEEWIQYDPWLRSSGCKEDLRSEGFNLVMNGHTPPSWIRMCK